MSKTSWWVCAPDEFYQQAKVEAERMRVEQQPPAVLAHEEELLRREEEELQSGYTESILPPTR